VKIRKTWKTQELQVQTRETWKPGASGANPGDLEARSFRCKPGRPERPRSFRCKPGRPERPRSFRCKPGRLGRPRSFRCKPGRLGRPRSFRCKPGRLGSQELPVQTRETWTTQELPVQTRETWRSDSFGIPEEHPIKYRPSGRMVSKYHWVTYLLQTLKFEAR
jgi:hypothetical protein